MTPQHHTPAESPKVAPRANQTAAISIPGRVRDGRESPGATEGRSAWQPTPPAVQIVYRNGAVIDCPVKYLGWRIPEAVQWGELNISNGEWNVCQLAWPYLVTAS